MKKLFCLLCLSVCIFWGVEDFKVKIGVSIPVQEYFVKKIGGDFVDVIVLVPQARNPKFFEPTATQVKMIKNLSVYVASGIPFEKKWLKRFENANPSLRVLNLTDNACKDIICYQWLSIQMAKKQAKKIAYILRSVDIKNAKIYKENLALFLKELQALENKIKQRLALPATPKAFGGFQDTWRGFAKDFGLQYLDVKNTEDLKIFRQERLKKVLITPFDIRKQVKALVANPKVELVEINPYTSQWEENIWQVLSCIIGE